MSFILTSTGDNFHRGWNTVGKKPLSTYTPVVGDLVAVDTTLANGVDIVAGTEAIWGIVESVNNNNGTLSVTYMVTGCTIELPYHTSVSLGDKVKFYSATQPAALPRTVVQTDNSNGVGTVIAVDADSPHGTGYCVVLF
jgi:uncharacterized protein YkvS